MKLSLSLLPVLVVVAVMLPGVAAADRAHQTTDDPGFRPYSEYASSFVEALDSATIKVHPTLLRAPLDDTHHAESQRQIVASIQSKKIASALEEPSRIRLGVPDARSQWQLFLNDIAVIAEHFRGEPEGKDFHLFLMLFAPLDDGNIFAIHCYVVDAHGRNTFSFLLNSHHRLFADAKLTTRDTSERGRAKLVKQATEVAMEALEAQVRLEHAKRKTATQPVSRKVKAGVFEDFESGLPSGKAPSGIGVGFMPVSSKDSTSRISTAAPPTPVPDQKAGKAALKLDLNAPDWAAFLHKFANEKNDRWVAYDWSDFTEFSFWVYGHNSGALLFVDILDNRKLPLSADDAELYSYSFPDDVAGWKKVTIRFSDMHRKEVGNGAPVDGLGLTAVHGWAFGAANTGGPVTYYLENLELQSSPFRDPKYAINELPMYGRLQKSGKQLEADQQLIERSTKGVRSREDAAETVSRMGWTAFYDGDHSLAIKRFNQAWILNPKNQLALWGFATVCIERDQLEEAVRYFDMAMKSGPENERLRHDYEKALRSLEQRDSASGKHRTPSKR